MNFTLSKPSDTVSEKGSKNIDEVMQRSVLFSRLEDMIGWEGKTQSGPFHSGFPVVLSRWPLQ